MIHYNELAEEYARHRQVHPGVVQALLETGEVSRETRVLEVGCGTGNYVIRIAETTGCQAWGIDPSEGMLAKARARSQKVRFLPGRAEALEIPDCAFDLIFSVDVIHHVGDREAYFREAWRVLAHGGRLCTVTDSEAIIRQRRPLAVYFPETVEADLNRYPALKALELWVVKAGFHEIMEARVDFSYTRDDIQAFREQAYSCLHLIPKEAFRRGLRRMEEDLEKGPIECISSYVLLWGRKE
jgi:ubiquinone/menaquinone biosynthesis C-methylase UbiE